LQKIHNFNQAIGEISRTIEAGSFGQRYWNVNAKLEPNIFGIIVIQNNEQSRPRKPCGSNELRTHDPVQSAAQRQRFFEIHETIRLAGLFDNYRIITANFADTANNAGQCGEHAEVWQR
jgi:hypothetical protein